VTKSTQRPSTVAREHARERTLALSPSGKSERVTVLLPPELHAQVRHEADRRLLSMSAVVREILVRHFHNGHEEGEA
jgi:hypothetical protein